MQPEQYIDNMQKIQQQILTFLEDEANNEEIFENLQIIFSDQKITENKYEFKSLLYLISNIGNYHYRNHNFFYKLEKIFQLFEDDIQKNFTNSEVFNIFANNMRLLLYLFEKNILIFNEYVYNKLSDKKDFITYFSPEINENIPSESIKSTFGIRYFCNDEFYKLRRLGENENKICEIIRNDNVTEFIIYTNRNNILTNKIIEKSCFETNPLLVGKDVNLIEYAAFYGSIQIFNYLKRHIVNLDQSIWYFAIHGNNAEIIHELEEDGNISKQSFLSYFKESIKCHHNDLANYFHHFFLEDEDSYLMDSLHTILDYYNFTFMNDKVIDESLFDHLVKNDYITLVDFFLKTKDIDINKNISLYHAVEKVHIEIITLLSNIDKIDINAYNAITCYDEYNKICGIQKKTALYLAIEDENIEIIQLLLTNNNLDINIFNQKYDVNNALIESKTALYLAVEIKNAQIVKLLLTNKNINVNLLSQMNVYLETALCLAVSNENFEIVKLLLSNKKIDVNIPSEETYKKRDTNNQIKIARNIINTPLHFAVENMNVKIVKLLLKQKNIDIQIKNYYGKTAFEYAKNEKIKRLFPP